MTSSGLESVTIRLIWRLSHLRYSVLLSQYTRDTSSQFEVVGFNLHSHVISNCAVSKKWNNWRILNRNTGRKSECDANNFPQGTKEKY
jgi:hypothetical protein